MDARDVLASAPGCLQQEMLSEERDVFPAFPQSGERDVKDVEPVKRVRAGTKVSVEWDGLQAEGTERRGSVISGRLQASGPLTCPH